MGTLMIQGTTSDAGKSTMVAGLCRILHRKNISVAPFKPQNMALNSTVTKDSGEIGRAQAFQALACGIEPHSDMNPILLKPNSDIAAQVIIQGHAIDSMNADAYHDYKKVALQAVLESYNRLKEQYDVILVEGAGSPAEINLRENDIANMGFAEKVDCPVWIVADIDRGGVFAHLTGTLNLLSESEQQRVSGFLINRFRGDYNLLKPGIDWLDNYTGKKTVGTIPYIHGLQLEAEDALCQKISLAEDTKNSLTIIIPLLPHISNHTDFDPLITHKQINLRFVTHEEKIPPADLIIIPGSKNVITDLRWLKSQGWESAIKKHLRYNGKLLGICGGFQMLGRKIFDPDQIESSTKSTDGLNLLNITTEIQKTKQLQNISGTLNLSKNKSTKVYGYEIHAGITTGEATNTPFASLSTGNDGVISTDNQIAGTYLHGLFETDEACRDIFSWAGLNSVITNNYHGQREEQINCLADTIENNIDLDYFIRTIRNNSAQCA